MNAWAEVPIGDVMAGFFDGPHATPKPSDDGPIYLGIKNMTVDGHLDLSQPRHISWDDFPRWVRRVEPEPGDLVFTYEASLHRYAMIPPDFKGCLGRRIALIRPDTSAVDGRFLLYQFLGPQWRSEVTRRINIGSTVDRIPLTEFPKFPIQLPPLDMQRKIAAVLAAYDELIENNLRRIEILEEMAQAVYREWFVNLRYPGHEDAALVDSSLGPIPEGWKIGVLGAIASVNEESIRQKDAPSEIRYIDISSVSPGSINAVASMRFEDAPSRARRVVHHGDTIWSTVRPNRRSFALVLNPAENTIVSTGFAVLRPRTVPWVFLHLATSTMEFSVYLSNHARGAAYPAVNAEDFENARLAIPTEALLDHFAPLIEPMFELRENLRRQNANLRSTRDLLLPKLVSGEFDVSDLDIEKEWLAS